MAPSTNVAPERDLEYILSALKHATEFKIDYHALVLDEGKGNANTAQKKFKAAVERSGRYKLVGGKVVENDAAGTNTTTTAAPPITPTTPTTTAAPPITPTTPTTPTTTDIAPADLGDVVPQTPKKRKAATGGTPKKSKKE